MARAYSSGRSSGSKLTKPHGAVRRASTGTKTGRGSTPSDSDILVKTNRDSGPRLRHPKG